MSAEVQLSGGPLVELCAAADVGSDTPLRVVLGSEAYVVFNVDGLFHVTQDRSTAAPCMSPLRTWTVWVVDGHLFIDPSEYRRSLAG